MKQTCSNLQIGVAIEASVVTQLLKCLVTLIRLIILIRLIRVDLFRLLSSA
jgi:hypothetical protein